MKYNHMSNGVVASCRRGLLLVALLIAPMAATKPAQAQAASHAGTGSERRERPPAAAPPVTRWYGYQTGLSDVAAVGMIYGAVATYEFCWNLGISLNDHPAGDEGSESCDNSSSTAFALAGAGTYLFGAPTVHALHGSWEKAGLSFGMRSLPIVLGVGLAQSEETNGLAAAVLIAGPLLAMTIDHAWLAREEAKAQGSAWYVAPTVDLKKSAAHLSVGASF
ncbi:MAG: hypothetical protein SFV15_11445 [Polyangiaceae bacterium]|nr:hypothetical protein [Polyangiaceae bacterium]